MKVFDVSFFSFFLFFVSDFSFFDLFLPHFTARWAECVEERRKDEEGEKKIGQREDEGRNEVR